MKDWVGALGLAFFWAGNACAQEAFKANWFSSAVQAHENRDENSGTPISLGWTQVAGALETSHPVQLNAVLGLAYRWNESWTSGVNYDFRSFVFEISRKVSESTESSLGWDAALVPELRSFSWKWGPWATLHWGRARLSAIVQIASVTTVGYGLWATEIAATARGRAYVLPTQLRYAYDFQSGFQGFLAFEHGFDFKQSLLKSRDSVLLGFRKDLD